MKLHQKDECYITLILPSYNVYPYIRQCLESVIAQSLRNIEILCIDAGSTDGTEEVLEEFADRDPRIRVIHSEKKSYGYQMNLGIREAQGKYIGIVETDDYVDPSMYEILYRYAEKHSADIVKCGRYEIYEFENGESIKLPVSYVPDNVRTDQAVDPDAYPTVHRFESNVWNGVYRRSFLIENNIHFNESAGAAFQDIGFFHLVLNGARKVIYLKYPLYYYRKIRLGASTWKSDCLTYLCTEYKRLFDMNVIKESHMSAVLQMMMASMLVELDKILCFHEVDENDTGLNNDIDWLGDVVRDGFVRGTIKPEDMKDGYRERVFMLLTDRSLYFHSYRRKIDILVKWLSDLRNKIGGRKLIIFGAGNYGLMMFQFLIRNDIRPEAFADNNIWLRNYTMFGIKVLTIDEAFENHKEAFYLICSKRQGNEMKGQLLDLGVSGKLIEVFDGSDPELYGIMQRLPVLQPVKQ